MEVTAQNVEPQAVVAQVEVPTEVEKTEEQAQAKEELLPNGEPVPETVKVDEPGAPAEEIKAEGAE